MRYSYAGNSSVPIQVKVQSDFKGPEIPEPMRESPGKDLAELADGFIGDVQGIAAKVSNLLDIPFDSTIKIPGPHRVLQGAFDSYSGTIRGLIDISSKNF